MPCLLRTPALFMLDNGNFTEENAKAIRYILGGSSKPNQPDSIGKFGLGLKSVFHLCEAFFYIAPDAINSKYRRWDIFNPWAGAENKDDYHEGWDIFSETDKNLIKTTLAPILSRPDYQEKWFILWIPLRQRSHKTIENYEDGIGLGWIKKGSDDFFEKIPDFFRNQDTKKQLSLLMTLLGTVNKIRYWENNFTNPQFSIVLESNAQRRSPISTLAVNQRHLLKGLISYNNNEIVKFTGSETISGLSIFEQLKSKSDFPDKFREIKPHNAIVFSRLRIKQTNHNLTLRTAVFLPIGEDEIIECQSEYSYYLTFHGYFFVDFARTGIMGWDTSTSTVNKEKVQGDDSTNVLKKSWNFELFNCLLSEFLNNFNNFIQQNKLSNQEIEAICTALSKSKLFRNNRQKICEHKQFIYCLTIENKWCLLERGKKILSLPKSLNEFLLPHLKYISEKLDSLFTLPNVPNLRHESNNSEPWSEQDYLTILYIIQEWISSKKFPEKDILFMIKEILKLSDSILKNLLRNNPNLKCLPAYSEGNLHFYSYNQFQMSKNKLCLFKNQNQNNDLTALVKAIKDFKPIIVENDIFDLIKDISEISPLNCNPNTCREILKTTPSLALPSQRVKLLNNLL